MKFKIGDRVRVKNCFDGINLKGKIGTVIRKGKRCDYGVEFDEPIELVGHSCDGMGKRGHCRYGYESELEPVCDKIIITSNGKKTIAILYENNKVVKSAEANCSPNDEFDFISGARIAFERLMEEKPKYREVHRKAKVGEYVRLVVENGDGTGGYGEEAYDRCGIYQVEAVDCLAKIRSKQGTLLCFYDYEYVVLEGYKPEEKAEKMAEKAFVPYLEEDIVGNKLGEIGKETKFVDVVGRKLCVGDVVELFDNNSESYGDRVVVEDDNTQFVMGISIACDCKTGHIGNDWKIIKKRSYKDVNNGETVDGVKFITEEQRVVANETDTSQEKLSAGEFYDKFCSHCGSQRCEGIGTDWFEGCEHKEFLKGER